MSGSGDSSKLNGPAGTQEDGEVVDLTEIASPEEENGERIIELTEVTPPASSEDGNTSGIADAAPVGPEVDEEIIVLTDIVSPEPETDEPVIELTDPAASEEADDEETVALSDTEGAELIDGEIIELTDMIEPAAGNEGEKAAAFAGQGDGTSGPEDTGKEESAEPVSDVASPSTDQLEAALERVVRDTFSEKIEGILVDVIEKVVKEEIERLNALLEDSAEDG